jgi:hypothetical protein
MEAACVSGPAPGAGDTEQADYSNLQRFPRAGCGAWLCHLWLRDCGEVKDLRASGSSWEVGDSPVLEVQEGLWVSWPVHAAVSPPRLWEPCEDECVLLRGHLHLQCLGMWHQPCGESPPCFRKWNAMSLLEGSSPG